MTQREQILLYLQTYGSITPMEVFELGITKLATRISEMRRDGIEFKIERVTAKNRFNHTVSFARYSLAE